MIRASLILVCLTVAFSPAAGQVAVSLSVSHRQDPDVSPYRQAELTLTNGSGRTVEAVELRPAAGGPAVRYPFAVPPGGQAKLTVALPAIWLVQTYRITATDAAGEVIGETSAEITWPGELASTDAFIDASLASWSGEAARWPVRARRNILLLSGMAVLALAATLLIRRPAVRAAAAAIAGLGSAVLLAAFALPALGPAAEVQRFELRPYDADGLARSDSFAVIGARRTAAMDWTAEPVPYPVYRDSRSAAEDDSVLAPGERTLSMTLRAGEVRIVRPGVRFAGGPAGLTRTGSIEWRGGQAMMALNMRPGSVLMRDETVWTVEPLPTSGRALWATRGGGRSLWSFLASADGQSWDADHRRLLMYWRDVHRRAGQAYVIEVPTGSPEVTRLEIIPLKDLTDTAGPSSKPAAEGPQDRQTRSPNAE